MQTLKLFINICCFGACIGPVWAFSMRMSIGFGLLEFTQIV